MPGTGLPLHVAVSLGTAGGETDRSGVQSGRDDVCHRLEVVGRRVVERPVAHHVGPNGGVGHLCADVEGVRGALERVEILRKGLPIPLDPFVEGGSGDVLDALHELDEPLPIVGADGREADTAVAQDRGGDPVPAGRRQVRIPRGLPVVVGVDVDEAGRHQQAVGVHGPARRTGQLPDPDDAAILDRDVCRVGRRARAVDHRSGTDHQIMHVTD